MGVPVDTLPVMNLHWLGMLGDRKFEVDRISPLDAMGNLMFEKLAFKPGELDLILLFHDFIAEYANGRKERITSRLVDFGIKDGDSAMSRTVSLPAAIAVQLVLEGKITTPGVLRPVTPEIYNPVLDELARLDIQCQEETEAF
jgi:saccharopine dehydrogenase-like NADP-dependent oxidoreductase